MTGQPKGSTWRRRLMVASVWLGVVAGSYAWGRLGTQANATAVPPASNGKATAQDAAPLLAESGTPSDYSRRIVAQLYEGKISITREDLGEYLIARYGKDKVKHLINKRIIDNAAREKGVEITPAEVNAALAADIKSLGLESTKTFEEQLLKRYNKSLYEWKEDVIRPRLIMERLCRSKVAVTREDLAKAHEAYFGEKVECKIIMWPQNELNRVMNAVWPKIRNNEEEFDRAARSQASPSLASTGGLLKPLGRNTIGDDNVEKVMFSLKPGEVSEVINTKEGILVVKCVRRIPPDTTQTYEQRIPLLEKEVMDRKVNLEIGTQFQQLYASAKIKDFLNPTTDMEAIKKDLSVASPPNSTPAMENPTLRHPAPYTPQGN